MDVKSLLVLSSLIRLTWDWTSEPSSIPLQTLIRNIITCRNLDKNMTHDLTTSAIERQNILNNNMAIPRIKEALDIETFQYEGKYYLTKQMVAEYYEVDILLVR